MMPNEEELKMNEMDVQSFVNITKRTIKNMHNAMHDPGIDRALRRKIDNALYDIAAECAFAIDDKVLLDCLRCTCVDILDDRKDE